MPSAASRTHCPYCRAELNLVPHVFEGAIRVGVVGSDSFECTVKEALLGYLRWVAEGKPEKQYFYDAYHNHVEFRDGQYHFSIQTLDSPEGDTWARGSFRLTRGLEIEDLKYETAIY